MAYTKKKLEELSLKAIEKHELIFYEDIIAFLPVSKTTFYHYKLHESDSIREAMEKHKISTKSFLRKEWKTSQSAVERIALYRLLANSVETNALNGNVENKTTENKTINIGFSNAAV